MCVWSLRVGVECVVTEGGCCVCVWSLRVGVGCVCGH